MIDILTYHGWAFRGNIWTEWVKRLNADHIRFRNNDRGYFGDPVDQTFLNEEGLKVIFAHSFGLHWIPADTWRKADLLVLFNGFKSLSRSGKDKKLTTLLRAMIKRLRRDPEGLLNDFYQLCYNEPHYPGFGAYNKRVLLEDLKRMSEQPVEIPDGIFCKVILFGAEDDRIVDLNHMYELNELFEQVISEYKIPNSSHALPFTKKDQCISLINDVIPILENYESKHDYFR